MWTLHSLKKKRTIKFKSQKLMKHVYDIQKSIFEGIKNFMCALKPQQSYGMAPL